MDELSESHSLEMVEVVSFRRGKEWEVVSTVRDGGGGEGQGEPDPGCSDVGAHNQRSHQGRQNIGDNVL